MNETPTSFSGVRDAFAPDQSPDELTRIGDMAARFGVSLRTLRFYEDKGLLTPLREGNTRLYTTRDRARMKLIMLGRKVGFSLRDVKQMIDLHEPSGTSTKQFKLALEKSERQMVRLEKQRVELDGAIEDLGEAIGFMREQLSSRAVGG